MKKHSLRREFSGNSQGAELGTVRKRYGQEDNEEMDRRTMTRWMNEQSKIDICQSEH